CLFAKLILSRISIKKLAHYRFGDGDRLFRGEVGDRRRVRPLSRSLEY
ncbi:unnamed protein product, partial [Rotaria magnacalcarata]